MSLTRKEFENHLKKIDKEKVAYIRKLCDEITISTLNIEHINYRVIFPEMGGISLINYPHIDIWYDGKDYIVQYRNIKIKIDLFQYGELVEPIIVKEAIDTMIKIYNLLNKDEENKC